jgi:hypothetical protein
MARTLFRSAPANVIAGGAPLRRVDDATVIADPVGQCALTTAAEDTVQFVAAVTDHRSSLGVTEWRD